MNIEVRPVRGRRDVADFVGLPWRVYAGDPHWVPPLRLAVRRTMSRRHNPFHDEATVEHFVARTPAGSAVGRIAVTVYPSYVERYGPRALFGFFESAPDERVATALFRTAERWATDRGMESLIGPYSYTSAQEVGVLVDGFDTRPAFLQAHTPRYYEALLDSGGYKRAYETATYSWTRRLHSHVVDELVAIGDRVAAAEGITVRPVDLRRYAAELETFRQLYNRSFAYHPESTRLSRAVFAAQAAELRPVIDPDIARVVERDGRPIGFCLLVPDVNEVLARCGGAVTPALLRGRRLLREVSAAVVVMMGADPAQFGRGLGRVLRAEIVRAGATGRYDTIHTTWIHQDNASSRAIIDKLGTAPVRRYAVFEKAL